MLTDTDLKSKVDSLWEKLWTGGLANPMDAIEQFSYLLFMKRLDEAEKRRQQMAQRRGQDFVPKLTEKQRWDYWTQLPAGKALKQVKEEVFPVLKTLAGEGSSFDLYMRNAEFKINKPNLLIEACTAIDQMQISSKNQDVQGDLYEYLLSKLSIAGRNGQFRTPRHIIRMMVQMMEPQAIERICDPAAGTCGFLLNAYQYILEQNTSPDILEYDEEGFPHQLIGDRLDEQASKFLHQKAITGYDNDSGMSMLRIGSMNLMLHGIENPRFFYHDSLAKSFEEESQYDVVLANPPFKGAVDVTTLHPSLDILGRQEAAKKKKKQPGGKTKAKAPKEKTELLFIHLFLRLLDMGGRCAAIVPDGVLFGSSKAHVATRKKLIEENRLDGIVSMPSGVFKPYAGVSTAIVFFTKGATTDRIWFYDMGHDGFSLDDKRQPVKKNDIPDILACWQHRHDKSFVAKRQKRLGKLVAELEPLKAKRLELEGEIHKLVFEDVIALESDEKPKAALAKTQEDLDSLKAEIAPLQAELDQLNRQFWVEKEQVTTNKYDLSASRYRQVAQEAVYYETPKVTMERLLRLEHVMAKEVSELEKLLE